MKNLIVRPLKKSDVPALLELYRQYDTDIPPQEAEKAILETWPKIEQNENIFYLAGEYDQQMVSTCFLLIIPQFTRSGRPYGLIENVITHPSFRKQGVATAVLESAIQLAWNHDCVQVMLLTGNKKPEATRLYEKVGFKQGIKKGYIIYNT